MFPSETIERMENVAAALAKNERDQLEAGLATSAAETGYALKDAVAVLAKLKEARTALTLPRCKHVYKEADLTSEERIELQDNDPVAGTEFREMATLFDQMMTFVHEVSGSLKHRESRLKLVPDANPDSDGPAKLHPPEWWPGDWTEEAVRLMHGRAQSLYDRTHAFTRSLIW